MFLSMLFRGMGYRSAIFMLAAITLPLAAAPAAPAAANALLQEGTTKLSTGESAFFPITGGEKGPANLSAQCDIGDVGGTASLTFDGEHYVPLSDPPVGTVITLSRGDTRSYDLSGIVNASSGGEAYIAFHFTGAPTPMCFPGMDCGGAEGASSSVTVTCWNVGG